MMKAQLKFAVTWLLLVAALTFSQSSTYGQTGSPFSLEVEQITHGRQHHFFGYIGQSLTTPWNKSGRYILTLRTTFHDRMPGATDAADICLIDTQNNYAVTKVDETTAWNFQQGTMFYWHPKQPETQFFFNDRDPKTNLIFTVLYDIEKRKRIREYRFDTVPVANGGVSPTGDFFLAINYARMARLRPVTGYPETTDQTESVAAPTDDGIYRVDIESGKRKLLVSFAQLRDLLRDRYAKIDEAGFYINHSLCSRDGKHVYFYARGRVGSKSMAVNVPCSVTTDGTDLKAHEFIGGHPEWDEGSVVIGAKHPERQVRYDIVQQKIIGEIGETGDFPNPEGDVSVGPRGEWFVNGYPLNNRKNIKYIVMRRKDKAKAESRLFSRGPYQKGDLRIDPAPRWNRDATQILVPDMTKDGTRQLHLLKIKTKSDIALDGPKYNFVCADFAKGEVCVVDQSGKIKRTFKAKDPNDVWALPDGKILFAWRGGVKLFDREDQLEFEWNSPEQRDEIHTCQPLANGNILIAQNGRSRLIEVNRKGEIVKEIPVASKNDDLHMRFRMCRKLPSGHYLCMVSCDNEIRELDGDGKLVRRISNLPNVPMKKPHAVVRLPNGNTLFSTGAGATAVEVDENDKIVWKLEPSDLPEIKMGFMTGLNRLANGNTVICFYQGSHHLIEVTPAKKLVWKWRIPSQKTIVSVQVLDEQGEPRPGAILK